MTQPLGEYSHGHAPRLTNRWVVLALLVMIALLNYADRFLMSGLAQPIQQTFQISDATMGLLMGPAFALLYTICTVPAARLADTGSRVRIIAGGCAMWSGFTVLSGMATTPWMLALARVGVGIGEAAFQAPAAALVAAYFSVEQRGKALALMGTAIYFGQMAGFAGGPAIAEHFGWRAAFHAIGFAGLVVALATMLIVTEPKGHVIKEQDTSQSEAEPFLVAIRRIAAARSLWLITVLMGLGTLSGMTFAMWGPSLFARSFALTAKDAGSAIAFSFGLPALLGMLLFGALADRLARRDPAAGLRLAAASLAVATTLILGIVWSKNLAAAQMLAVPSGLLGGGWSVGVYAALQYMLPDRLRATGTGIVLLITGILGSVIGPVVAGQLSDWVSTADPGAHGLQIGLSVALPLAYLGAWAGWRAMRLLEADKASLHA